MHIQIIYGILYANMHRVYVLCYISNTKYLCYCVVVAPTVHVIIFYKNHMLHVSACVQMLGCIRENCLSAESACAVVYISHTE